MAQSYKTLHADVLRVHAASWHLLAFFASLSWGQWYTMSSFISWVKRCMKKSIGSVPSTFILLSPKKGGRSPSNWLSLAFQTFLTLFSFAFFPWALGGGGPSGSTASSPSSASTPSATFPDSSPSLSLLDPTSLLAPVCTGSHSSSLLPEAQSSSLESGNSSITLYACLFELYKI